MTPDSFLRLLVLSLPALLVACSGSGGSPNASVPTSEDTAATSAAAEPAAADVALVAAAEAAADRAHALAVADAPAPVATATLTALRYTDANNWFMRSLQASAEDNVPDAQGMLRYFDMRRQSASNSFSANGVVQAWGFGNTQSIEGRLFWNGSAWVDCKLGTRGKLSVRDAQGRHVYSYCDGYEEGSGVRRVVDVSGQSIAATVRDYIRTFPGGDSGVDFASWGPANLALYGTATFPAGSALHYQLNTVTRTAYAYDVPSSNAVVQSNLAVSAGGDARANPALACGDPAQNGVSSSVVSLEDLRARHPGKPCIFNQGGTSPNVSGARNEYWGGSTVGLGDLAGANTLPPGTGNYYTTTATLRVGFTDAGNGVTFYTCYRRTSDSSSRNCSVIGSGTWSIQTLGDARVMSFSVAPALAQKLGYARVFVERGGKVYYGIKNPVNVLNADIRLNLPAANAVLRQLGLPLIQPVTQPGAATGARAAALASIKGVWGGATADGATIFRFGDNGRMLMAEAKPFLAATREQSGAELGWLDYDPASKLKSTLLEVDSNLTSGTSHPYEAGQPTDLVSDGRLFGELPRLPTASSATSLLGLWAVDSATDLSTVHLAFFANGRVMVISGKKGQGDGTCTTSGQDAPGVEFASYTFDAPTGRLRIFGRVYDTDGCQGVFDGSPAAVAAGRDNVDANITATIAADGKSMLVNDGGASSETWYRIAAQ